MLTADQALQLNHEEHEEHEERQARCVFLSPDPAGDLHRQRQLLLLFVIFVLFVVNLF
jgi:hypothetical protein